MHRVDYRPTRRKPQKRDVRQATKPNAHPRSQTATDRYRVPNASNHITLPNVLCACAFVLCIVAFVWALGASYQAGYQAGLEWVAS